MGIGTGLFGAKIENVQRTRRGKWELTFHSGDEIIGVEFVHVGKDLRMMRSWSQKSIVVPEVPL